LNIRDLDNPPPSDNLEEETSRLRYAWLFYYHNTSHIEITMSPETGGDLEKYYFPVHPACRYIPLKEKHKYESQISRENDVQKRLDIIKQKDSLITLIDHIFKLRLNYKIKYDLPDQTRTLCLLLAFFYNFFYFINARKRIKYVPGDMPTYENFLDTWAELICRLIG
jgi:hypothetical protein